MSKKHIVGLNLAFNLESDGDMEHAAKLVVAKDMYLKGCPIKEIVDKCEIKEHIIRYHIMKPNSDEPCWADQRKDARIEFIKECGELTKISLSEAYRGTANVLFKCLNKLAKDLDDGKMSANDTMRATDILLKGTEKLHNLFMPALKQPLVNLTVQNNPTMTESDLQAQLTDWGLENK